MELNSVLFPAPSVFYTPEDLEGDVMYIPRFFKYDRDFRIELNKNIEK